MTSSDRSEIVLFRHWEVLDERLDWNVHSKLAKRIDRIFTSREVILWLDQFFEIQLRAKGFCAAVRLHRDKLQFQRFWNIKINPSRHHALPELGKRLVFMYWIRRWYQRYPSMRAPSERLLDRQRWECFRSFQEMLHGVK